MPSEPNWRLLPRVASCPMARRWLERLSALDAAANTIASYGYTLELYLEFCSGVSAPDLSNRGTVVAFVAWLRERAPRSQGIRIENRSRISNSTLQVRLSALRGWFDHLVDFGEMIRNPIGRGRYVPTHPQSGIRGLIPRTRVLPWIPWQEQWEQILNAMRDECIRNRCMFALQYCGALRREEVCATAIERLDVGRRLLRVFGKGRRERVVFYSPVVDPLLKEYLQERRRYSSSSGALFLSESNRNRASPLGVSAWTKVIERIADTVGLPAFTTHTVRHRRLTDLAVSGWQLHEIAAYAGHTDQSVTLQYIHLSGRELGPKLLRTMAAVDKRLETLN
jgi:integrase/recombinase XerD